MRNPVGWLPYGSDDPSVLFYDPLTSEVKTVAAGGRIPATTRLISAGGGGTVADIVHDAVKGMKAYNDGTKYAAYRFQTFNDVGSAKVADFQSAGQITFEIESAWMTDTDSASSSTGYVPAADQCALSFSMATGVYRMLQKLASDAISYNAFGATSFTDWYTRAVKAVSLSSWGKGDFIKVNIGWNGGKVGGKIWFAFDDQLVAYGVRNQSATGLLTDMFLGSSSGGQTSIVNNHFIRKLQMATRPPMHAVLPKLRNIVIWGDSQVKDLTNGDGTGMEYNIGPCFNSTPGLELAKNLNAKGLFANIMTRGYSGYSIATDGTHTSLATTAAAIKALNPVIVLLEAGTNDAVGVGGSLYANFESDFKALVVDMLGHPSVKGIGLRTVPSAVANAAVDGANFRANRAAIDAIVKAMPDYIDTTYPQYAGRVKYVDAYTRLGGESPAAGTFFGQLPGGQVGGVPNNLHYAAFGGQIEGACWFDVVKEFLKAA